MTDLTALGARIQEARERADLTREQLAARLGVSHSAVMKWETDQRTPGIDGLCRLSDVLSVTTGWLLGRRQRGKSFTSRDGVNPGPPPAFTPPGWPCLAQPGGCICKCHAVRAGKLNSNKTPKSQANVWLPEHDVVLRDLLASGVMPEQIAVDLSERFKIPRSEGAVKTRAIRLGISLYDGWISSTQLARKLGVRFHRIETWRNLGYLKGVPGFKQWTRYLDHEVEAFVKKHAGLLFDPRLVRDPKLKPLAETSAIVNKRKQAG